MPTFKLTSPQGQTYEVTGPEGSTEQQALQMLQRKLAGMPPPPSPQPAQAETPSLGQEISGQFGAGVSKAASAFNPLSPENRAITERASKGGFFDPSSSLERGKLLASGVGGAMQAAGSPIAGAVRAYGAPVIQSLDAPMRTLAQTIFGKDAKTPAALTHEQAADVAESLMSGLAPRGAVGGARVPGVAKAPAPALDEIFESSNAHYDKLKEMNVPLRPDVQAKLGDTIKGTLEKDAFYKEDQPRTFRAIERLAEGEASSKKIYAVRTALGRVVSDLPGSSDALAAGKAIEHLDEYLSNVPGFGETAKAARQDWAAAKTSQMVQELEHKAQRAASASGSGANLDNATRQQVKSLLNNSKKAGRLSAEEKAVAEQLVSGGKIGNIARLLSKLGPKHPLTGWGSAIAADFGGGSGAATASLGVGAIAQWLAEKMTTGKIRKLDEMIRSRSALAQSPREEVIHNAKMALKDNTRIFTKEEKEQIRMAAKGTAPADIMLRVKGILSADPLERKALQVGRSGRPIQTEPLNIGSEKKIIKSIMDEKKEIKKMRDMGFTDEQIEEQIRMDRMFRSEKAGKYKPEPVEQLSEDELHAKMDEAFAEIGRSNRPYRRRYGGPQ